MAGGTQWLGPVVLPWWKGGSAQAKSMERPLRKVGKQTLVVAVEHPWFKRGISSPPSLTALEHTELLFIIPHPLWGNTS